jgi:hypothetical protein
MSAAADREFEMALAKVGDVARSFVRSVESGSGPNVLVPRPFFDVLSKAVAELNRALEQPPVDVAQPEVTEP